MTKPELLTTEAFSKLPIPQQLQMFSKLPFYEQAKIWITAILQLTTDAIHIYIGVACLVLMVIVAGRKPNSFTVLIPGFLASLAMEVIDLYFDWNSLGFFRWMASAHDLVNTNLIPIILVCLFRIDFGELATKRSALLSFARRRFFRS